MSGPVVPTNTPAPPAPSVPPRSRVDALRARVAEAHRAGAGGREVNRLMAASVEEVVTEAYARAIAAHPLPGAALLALGGFGRYELAPHSDVDLLLVVPERAADAADRLARDLFTPLWDAGLEPGTALRTMPEALAHAFEDQTSATALLDARCIAGDAEVARRLLQGFWEKLHGERLEAFIDAKVGEIEERRRRFGGSVYLLEPNLKTGVGGLRDLAGGLWVARARHRLRGITGVTQRGLLPRRELDRLRAARDTIFRFRCQLHLQAGRRDDRLTFVAQEAASAALGYRDEAGELAVERFMRDYYLAAQAVEHSTDALVDRCLHEWAPSRGLRRTKPLTDHLELFDGRVTLREGVKLVDHPRLLVDLFAVAEREQAEVLSAARDRVAQEVERLGASLADCVPARTAFLEYLESPGVDGTALLGLYQAGVLGGLFPEFARLQARVQHDVYHVYTVDTHSLFALQKLLRLRAGLFAAELPAFTRLCQDLPRPLPLYVGLFFHDLGKGLGGDHSAKGEVLVRAFAAKAGLDERTADDAAFLVREHLKLSQMAFRRDLSDPSLVRKVVDLVGSRERLDMLYLLTYADISSVGPETWNEWRARLLAELWSKTRAQFGTDGPAPDAHDHTEAAQAGARALRQLVKPATPELERFIAALPERYLATVSPPHARAHFELWARSKGRVVVGAVVPRPGLEDAAELVVVANDRPGLLAQLTGVLAAHSIDILGAEIFSLADGRALDAFLVREPGGLPPSHDRVARALADLERVFDGRETVPGLLARRRGPALGTAAGPAILPKVSFDLTAARDATVVDVFGPDRVGLLHDLAAALHDAGCFISLARIATEGRRAIDSFYLQDLSGHKVTDEGTLGRIEQGLRAALVPPA